MFDNIVLLQDQKVEFNFFDLHGIGIIKGRRVQYYPLSDMYIVEMVESTIEVEDYPYSCIEIPQNCLKLIE